MFLNRFLPGEVLSGISVLTADGRCFSGIVGKFSEINLHADRTTVYFEP